MTSGPDKSVQIVEMTRGRHIEIHIRYVATTVIVRQVGQFLTFAIRMPEIIIEKQQTSRTNNGIDVGLMPMVSLCHNIIAVVYAAGFQKLSQEQLCSSASSSSIILCLQIMKSS